MADETILIKVEIEGSQAQKDLTASLDKQSESIARLREENKKLTKERNEVNFNSAEGKKKLEELNAQLDQNNKKIKENVDQYTKQKIGVGDYKAALDKLVPGLGATATGFGTMTKQALAFIATPIGAVIAALGVTIGALTAYFKGSEEGQDKLAKVTAVLGVAFEKLMQVVEFVGEAIFKYIEFWAGAVKSFIDFLSPALGQMLDEAIDTGSKIAEMQDAVDARENELIVKRAETNKKVAELRRQAIQEEGDQKRKTIQEAIDLEEELSRVETEQAQARLDAYKKEIEGKGLKTEEEKQKIAELTAARINAEAQAAEATLRFQKELEKLNEEDRQIKDALRRADSELFEQGKIHETEIVARELDLQTSKLDTSLKFQQDLIDKQLAAKIKSREKEQAAAIKDQQTQTRIAELEAQNRLMIISQTLGQAQALFEKDSIAHKFLGVARATVDTYVAANLALSTYPPPFGAIAAAASIATGLANVTKILDIGFAEGGYTGDGGKHDVAGVVHRGEYVVPKHIVQNPMYSGYISTLEGARQRGYADGGLVTNSATAQIEQQAMMAKAFEGAQFWLSITELQNVKNSVDFKDRLVTI